MIGGKEDESNVAKGWEMFQITLLELLKYSKAIFCLNDCVYVCVCVCVCVSTSIHYVRVLSLSLDFITVIIK